MGQEIYFQTYVSSATKILSEEELLQLLEFIRKKNLTLGLTGLLLHHKGNFIQLIEGPEKAVKETFAKIRIDKRHKGVIDLLNGFTGERQFADWSMGFHELKSLPPAEVEGFSNFLNGSFDAAETRAHATEAQRLLLSFKRGLR